MPRRIDIELTSSLGDGTWTWRAAGARHPRGVVDDSMLPAGVKVGDEIKVEIEQDLEGVTVLGTVSGRAKADRDDRLELLPIEREFQPVVETRARGGGDRVSRDRDRGDRPRRPRPARGDRPDRGDRPGRDDRGDRSDRGDRADRPRRDDRGRDGGRGERTSRDTRRRGADDAGADRRGGGGRRGPSFTPPPEIPQRPKPKRLRPGKAHRSAVLAELPVEQRAIAELALQGLPAVRQRLKEENDRAAAEGRATMPEASVMKIAEGLLPRLRVAEWLDRADAAMEQADELDLRDLRSVVVAGSDPIVARDESTRVLGEELKRVLATKQEQELQFWYGDIDASLAVGRVIRALRLSSQPPKAGVPFPTDIAQRLADSANASLAPMDPPERWSAMLEAAAFSPVRALVKPLRKPDVIDDELTATVKRVAPALPHVAALFEVTVDATTPMPKPLRLPPRGKPKSADVKSGGAPARPKSAREPAREKPRRDDTPANDAPVTLSVVDDIPPAADAPLTDEAPAVVDETPAVVDEIDAVVTDEVPAASDAVPELADSEPVPDAPTS